MITRDPKYMNGGAPSAKLLAGILKEREPIAEQLQRMRDYYDGKQAILSRTKTPGTANNKIVVNHARYIATMASSYLIGSPVQYAESRSDEAGIAQRKDSAGFVALMDAYARADIDSLDIELAKQASIYGRGVELAYIGVDSQPASAALDPLSAFVVYDDTVSHDPLFGVRVIAQFDEENKETGVVAEVSTSDAIYTYSRAANDNKFTLIGTVLHSFGAVPMVEYWNNDGETGDFAPVIGLIDAYNTVMSDRVNDKEQLVGAILMLTGADLGDSDSQTGATIKRLKDLGMLALPVGATAGYLTKQLSETDVDVLSSSIAKDLHKIAMVPALTDEDFARTSSGVAMRYKLFGLEQLTKGKEKWFREGLRERMLLYANILSVKGGELLDVDSIQVTFSRGLPVNDLEQAQMIAQLQGVVPNELLLGQLSFVANAKEANEQARVETQERVKLQQDMFATPGYGDDKPPDKEGAA